MACKQPAWGHAPPGKENVAPTMLHLHTKVQTAICNAAGADKAVYCRSHADMSEESSITFRGPRERDGHFEWDVHAILGIRPGSPEAQALVAWEGWPSASATWEPLSNLTHCDAKLDAFFAALEEQQAQLQRGTAILASPQ